MWETGKEVTVDKVALASIIIATSSVAILSGFVPVLVDWLRWKREKADGEMEAIDRAATELPSHLLHFGHWVRTDIEVSYKGPILRAYTELPEIGRASCRERV